MSVLTIPGAMKSKVKHIVDSRTMVRERTFADLDPKELLDFLRACHATGTVLIDLNQGGIGSLRFREEMTVTPP